MTTCKRHWNVGKDNPMYGKRVIVSEESKEKNRLAHLGKKHTEESKAKMGKYWLGRKHTTQTIKKMREVKLDEKNPLWKGDDVGYQALHEWVRRNLPIPEFCQMCNKISPYDLACITGKYTRDLKNWAYYCRKCHMISDDRIFNLDKYRPILKHHPKTGRFMKNE